jgi:signal transduction histidine kinase
VVAARPGFGKDAVRASSGNGQLRIAVQARCYPAAFMRGLGTRARGAARPAIVIAAIVAGMVTTVLLALEAYRAAAYHRRAARSVLRDYATLAANEMIRRSANQIGYYGYYPLARQLVAAVPRRERPAAPAVADLDVEDEGGRRPARLAQSVFVWNPGSGLSVSGPPLSPDVAAWLSGRLASVPHPADGVTVLHGLLAGQPHTFVVAGVPGQPAVIGFQTALPELSAWFERAFTAMPVLPPSLAHGAGTNDLVALVVRDHGGVERFRSQAREWPELQVEVPFGDAYEGVLGGSTVRVSLDPARAERLVIGGLPRSRLPALLALLVVTGGLLATALVLLRRERELQRLRSEFVASVSHELRTPLTQIRMFAETLLLDRVRSPQERQRALEIIDKEARRLTNLVQNLLMFSRSERGALRARAEPRALAPLLREIADGFRPLLAGPDARLETALDESVQAAVDPDAVRQIVLNLLDNAVKYGPRGGAVRLVLERAGGRARLRVEDQGPGIPGEQRQRIFERFHRLDRDRETTGTGIGLAVVRDLVEGLGGRVWVEEAEGGGARFVVELPE